MNNADVVALFSGGLDSLLAAKLLQSQGLSVLCVHFFTPFFGQTKPDDLWRDEYGLDVICVDLSADFSRLLLVGPGRGYGKNLNPCVDCKILQLSRAKEIMRSRGAKFLATGEVVGQRPMSQRRDTLNIIRREAGVGDLLLRPLSGSLLPPISVELEGLVDRDKLPTISGRGRTEQYELAKQFGLTHLPSPGGGCALTQEESARRYWPVIESRAASENPDPDALSRDLRLASYGRNFWRDDGGERRWLVVGRKSADNQLLAQAAEPGDLLLRLAHFPSPLALCRGGRRWSREALESAAALAASYSPKAVESGREVWIRALNDAKINFCLKPERGTVWGLPDWETTREKIRAASREAEMAAKQKRDGVR